MNFVKNTVIWIKRQFSTLSIKRDRHYIKFKFDNIILSWLDNDKWVGTNCLSLPIKKQKRNAAKQCAMCKYCKIQPGHDRKLIIMRRLMLVKKFVCLQNNQEVSSYISDNEHCPIRKW